MQTITIEQKVSRRRALVEAGAIVKFGLDVHAVQITVRRPIRARSGAALGPDGVR